MADFRLPDTYYDPPEPVDLDEVCPHEPICDCESDCLSLQREDAAIEAEDQRKGRAVSKSKAIGTKAETAIVKAARLRGFGMADRHVMKGALDEGDVWLCPGVIIEAKGGEMARSASDNRVEEWMAETERERQNANAEIAFLVIQRRGIGEANAHRWWAITTTDIVARLLGAGRWTVVEKDGSRTPSSVTCRMVLEDMLTLLRGAGWGDPL